MINLLALDIRNFLSYGNNITTIPLTFDEPILIVGENHDTVVDGEYDNNGTGKTTILNALTYCLYGKPVSKFDKIDDIINNINKKNLYVATTFEVNGTYYRVSRWRKNKKMGGSSNIGVKVASAPNIKGLDDPQNELTPAGRTVDEFIANEILGMPLDIFVRIVVFSARYKPFLSLPSTHVSQTSQTSIMEELFGHKELTEKGKKLKDRIKETKAEITQLTDLNERIEKEIQRYQEQLDFANKSIDQWNKDHEEKIQSIKDDINELEKIDFGKEIKNQTRLKEISEAITSLETKRNGVQFKLDEYEKNKKKYREWDDSQDSKISDTEKLLSPYENIDFDTELKSLDELQSLKAEYDIQSGLLEKQKELMKSQMDKIVELNDEVNKLKESKCPYCDQEYHDDDKISEKTELLTESALLYQKFESELNELTDSVNKLLDDMEKIECGFDSQSDYDASFNKYKSLRQRITDLMSMDNPYSEVVTSGDLSELETEIHTLNADIEALGAEYEKVDVPVHSLEELYAKQATLEETRKKLIDVINEENPHEETVSRLTKVFDNIDEIKKDEVDNLSVLLEHQEFLLKLLTKKDSFIRQELLDINLPFLNTRLRHYLDCIGLPHRAEFTKDMSISISQFGNPISYANLSGGQQARINIAISFAFRDIVQARHQKINFCILDECLDTGLSNLGVRLASQMIKTVAMENNLSMYVITHRDEIKSSFNKRLTTILKGGLTTIEMN
jgi:DNA repair exonuclease SbcCD ATPase subunit